MAKILENELFQCAMKRIVNTNNLSTIKNYFEKIDENERVKIISSNLNNDDITKIYQVNNLRNVNQKNEAKALIFKKGANDSFVKGKFDASVNLYTLCVAVAPRDTEIFSIGFANRGATLIQLGHFQEAIIDTQRAIRNNYPRNLVYKLYKRLGECYLKLGNYKLAVDNFNNSLESIKNASIDSNELKKFTDSINENLMKCNSADKKIITNKKINRSLPKISNSRNLNIPAASENIEMKVDETGVHFVAASDLDPGQVVAIEPLRFGILYDHQRYKYCSHCYKKCLNLYPCTGCIWTLYCSEECEKEAANYHNWECENAPLHILGEFKYLEKDECYNIKEDELGLELFIRLAMRVLSVTGIRNMEEFLNNYDSHAIALTSGFNDEGLFLSNDPHVFFTLPDKSKNMNIMHQIVSSFIAAFFLKIFNLDEAFIPFLLKFGKIHKSPLMITNRGNKTSCIGLCISPYLAHFKLNCNPNTMAIYYGDNLVFRLLHFVPKGDDLSVIYNMNYFWKTPKIDRAVLYKEMYGLHCNCEACKHNYSLHSSLSQIQDLQSFQSNSRFMMVYFAALFSITNNKYAFYNNDFHINKDTLPLFLRLLKLLSKYKKCNSRVNVDAEEKLIQYFNADAANYVHQLIA